MPDSKDTQKSFKRATELKPFDYIEKPHEYSGEVLSATYRGAFVYVRIAGRTEPYMLEPSIEVSIRMQGPTRM